MKIKKYILLVLIFQMINCISGDCQVKLSYDFNLGIKKPIIKGHTVYDKVDTCFNVVRGSAVRFDKRPVYARLFINLAVSKRIKVGVEAEVNMIKNEEFNPFQTPIYKNVFYFPLRIASEYTVVDAKHGQLVVKGGVGYVFGKTLIVPDIIEEQGHFNLITGLKYKLNGKLKGIYINFDYELQREKMLFDVGTLFYPQKETCPVYQYKANRSYLNFGIGASF